MASEHFANQERMLENTIKKIEQIAAASKIHVPLYWTNGFFCGIAFSFILYMITRWYSYKTKKIRTDLPYTTNLN